MIVSLQWLPTGAIVKVKGGGGELNLWVPGTPPAELSPCPKPGSITQEARIWSCQLGSKSREPMSGQIREGSKLRTEAHVHRLGGGEGGAGSKGGTKEIEFAWKPNWIHLGLGSIREGHYSSRSRERLKSNQLFLDWDVKMEWNRKELPWPSEGCVKMNVSACFPGEIRSFTCIRFSKGSMTPLPAPSSTATDLEKKLYI